ncbi:hypothetical protein HID58_078279 [Brassica napus]|uniref:Uncharacterized protein n=1 Tax=Brassica napus TaxID=3708 RepID=A0ABQ7YTG1_BRANA|nr:hypothetical protein HID58_078279 [Brassica napus]
MSSNGKSTLSGDSRSEKPKGVEADSFPGPIKPTSTPYVSSGLSIGDPHSKTVKSQTSVSSGLTKPIGKNPNGTIIQTTKTGVSSGVRGKAAVSSGVRGKAIVSADVGEVMVSKISKCSDEGDFWSRDAFHRPRADPSVTIIFSSTSVLSDLEDNLVCFPEDRFRFRGYEEFNAASDLRGDLYDYVGHIKLVNEQVLSDSIVLDDAKISSSRRVLLHVQTHDGPVMKLHLWDKAAFDFSERIKASEGTARVILVTTLNPKRFGGALALSSMTSSHVFLDSDVQATRDYLTWLTSNLAVANRVDAVVVTKTETVTIGELFSFMKQEVAKIVQLLGSSA